MKVLPPKNELVPIIIFPIIGLLVMFGPRELWYAIEYRVNPTKVYIEPRPTDCDFDPRNGNGCYYEKVITTLPAHNLNYDTVTVIWIKRRID
jgi:hypothetical protein